MRRAIPGLGLLVPVALPAFAGDFHVTMSNQTYALGQTVHFDVTNDRAESVFAPSWPYWAIVHEATGTLFHPCVGFGDPYEIGSGVTEFLAWEPSPSCDDDPAIAGTYRVLVDYWVDGSPNTMLQANAAFCLEECDEAVAVDPVVATSDWGRIKASYR